MSLEVRRLLQILAVMDSDHVGQTVIESECLKANLQMLECRKGCLNCSGDELVGKLACFYDRKSFEHGKADSGLN